MPSLHFIRWVSNLKNTNYELYWFDILNRGYINELPYVNQITNWQKRKKSYIKGEYFLEKKVTSLYNSISPLLKTSIDEKLLEILETLKPDLIHSFEMQNCSYPILKTFKKFSHIKWLYSCWGSDMYYYSNNKKHKKRIISVLQKISHLHTDNKRDYTIAKQLGFKGKHVGIIPGGTGYDLKNMYELRTPILKRNIILVKGYQHTFGRSINVLKALAGILEIKKYKQAYSIIAFGCHKETIDYIVKNKLKIKYYTRTELSHDDLIYLFGKSRVYVGNSISDGLPNTLLEAIVMNTFPIQSNPGRVTEEVIEHGVNGFLINDPNNIKLIKNLILKALNDDNLILKSAELNQQLAEKKLDLEFNKQKVIKVYKNIISEKR
ncbi:glycosyltransferase [Polaribacter sp. WD7]|nr:glycosyltransferase [Polaribacter sp. WD7]